MWSNGLTSFLTSTRKPRKTHFKADKPCNWLTIGNGSHSTCVDRGWMARQKMKNLRRLACKFDLNQKMGASHRKSTQVHARPGQTESQGDPVFNFRFLAGTFAKGLILRTRWLMYLLSFSDKKKCSNEHHQCELTSETKQNRHVGIFSLFSFSTNLYN